MMDIASSMSIARIAMPELEAVPQTILREGLCAGFNAASAELATIETCFRTVTATRGTQQQRRTFYRSWNMTNNSAMCVSGQANRLSALANRSPQPQALLLLEAISALNRITDEDLAVGSGILHAELFYRMATFFSEGDAWLMHQYMQPEATHFKTWRDRESLHHPQVVRGLLITLVHEIYTHSEVEFILPLFKTWAAETFGLTATECNRKLAWITVHCQGTETRHFGHALDALEKFAQAQQLALGDLDIEGTVHEYLVKKAACMAAITACYERAAA